MTQPPDDRQPEDPVPGPPDAEPALDEEAAWAAIVANYGERPGMFNEPTEPTEPTESNEPTEPDTDVASEPPGLPVGPEPVRRSVFDRSFLDSQHPDTPGGELNTEASWHDEGHFVPPPPPPLPIVEPRRRLAWAGLFGAPLLMLVAVAVGWTFPTWLSALLVTGFVGGFVYLVATMTRVGRGEGSDGDGAVV